MKGISEKTSKKLNELRQGYFSKLPRRFNEIKTLSSQAVAAQSDYEVMAGLKMALHKIAGSAATFGINRLTETAGKFEILIETIIGSSANIDQAATKLIHQYLLEMREICADPEKYSENTGLDEDGDNTGSGTEKKIVFVLGEKDSVAKDLSEQLGYFGYHVEILKSFSALKEHMEAADNELLILNSSIIENNPKTADVVKNIKYDYKRQLGIIFFSYKDNFDIRLDCVKAGGDDFFTVPLDVSRLIDRVDSLTKDENTNPFHILIIDDDPEQVSYYALLLQQAGMITSVASDPRKVLDIMAESKPDLILMDMYMPGCDGPELASIIRQQEAFLSIPIVYLSYESNKEIQLEAMRTGGDDFLTKPIKAHHLITSVMAKAERTRSLRYFMERDSLTGLLNHTNTKESLANEVLRAERSEGNMCFAMIDIDHFKKVNDEHGHMTGDRVLKSLSRLLQDRLRRTDIIGRYGGEEFAVILINTDITNASRIMDKIRQNFSQIRQISAEGDFYVTFSCGIASFPSYRGASELNSAADQALYKAKDKGRNQIVTAG